MNNDFLEQIRYSDLSLNVSTEEEKKAFRLKMFRLFCPIIAVSARDQYGEPLYDGPNIVACGSEKGMNNWVRKYKPDLVATTFQYLTYGEVIRCQSPCFDSYIFDKTALNRFNKVKSNDESSYANYKSNDTPRGTIVSATYDEHTVQNEVFPVNVQSFIIGFIAWKRNDHVWADMEGKIYLFDSPSVCRSCFPKVNRFIPLPYWLYRLGVEKGNEYAPYGDVSAHLRALERFAEDPVFLD